MTDNFKTVNPIIARIYNSNDIIIGTGFLISPHRLLTCAHVVMQALGIEKTTGMPQDLIKFDLPRHLTLTAKVIFWQPCSEIENAQYGEDIAVLEIIEPRSFNETVLSLLPINTNEKQQINIFGFPEGYNNGVWTENELRDLIYNGWLQMNQIKLSDRIVERGFSGSPVWNQDKTAIIGMVTASDLGNQENKTATAFAIPSSVLIDACLKFLELQDILLELDLKTVKKAYTECRQPDLDKPIPETIQEMIISFVDEAKFNENKNLDLNLFIEHLITSLNETKVIEWEKKYMAILTIDTAREINYDIMKVPNPLKDKYGYIERPDIESECYQKIATEDFIRIKGSVGMGKTWLLKQMIEYAKNQGHFTIRLDFNEPEKAVFDNLKAFYTWFCKKISRILGFEKSKSFIPYTDYHNDPSDNANITHYFEDHLLDNRDDQPKIILAIDNVDRLFTFPNIADDVCRMWRSWYDEDDGKIRNNIIMIITHSTMDYPDFNIDNSPLFGIGHVANLSDWEVPQVKSITQQYNLNLSVIEIDQLMLLIGGHPYLVRKAVEYLYQTSTNVENLLKIATNEDSPFSSYLDQLLQNLENLPELCKIYSQIIGGFSVRLNRTSKFHLDSMGLIKITENQILPKYLLYHNYFLAHLNQGE
jgi:V8-like Glu-specific endopeptidase